MKQIIVIGRGHSATRIPIHTLQESGVYCGNTNGSGDLIPAQAMYRAVRVFGALVNWNDGDYDFSEVLSYSVPPMDFVLPVLRYLAKFRFYNTGAWKLPEATLALPWITRIFPNAYYIHWVRDGRDNILRWHGTEDDWYGVDIDHLPEDRLHRAALSWDYHEELIAQTPKPARWLRVRLEDFLEDQTYELARMSEFLGIGLEEIYVNPRVAGRYKQFDLSEYMPTLERHLKAHEYIEETITV